MLSELEAEFFFFSCSFLVWNHLQLDYFALLWAEVMLMEPREQEYVFLTIIKGEDVLPCFIVSGEGE